MHYAYIKYTLYAYIEYLQTVIRRKTWKANKPLNETGHSCCLRAPR